MHTNDTNVYEYVIDFDELERGSDLWLFAKTTNLKENFDQMAVLLTPERGVGHVEYEFLPESMQLVIYGEGTGRVSYRLTAPRFDWKNWSNYADSTTEGFNLDKLLK